MVMIATIVKKTHDQRIGPLVGRLLKTLSWRWHGIGLLQAYVREGGDEEIRIHVWSPRLRLEGIDESGDIHDHRFDLYSTVLAGQIRHTEYELTEAEDGTHSLYTLRRNARRQLGTSKPQVGDDMIPGTQRYNVVERMCVFMGGMTYAFPRRHFHKTEPLTDIAVTLLTKANQSHEMARIIGPVGKPPVPAFGHHIREIPDRANYVLTRAQDALLELP